MEPRIAASVLAGGLIRKAESEGGFGAVLAKGDPTAGSILVILLEKGVNPRLFERLLQPDGRYAWHESVTQRSCESWRSSEVHRDAEALRPGFMVN